MSRLLSGRLLHCSWLRLVYVQDLTEGAKELSEKVGRVDRAPKVVDHFSVPRGYGEGSRHGDQHAKSAGAEHPRRFSLLAHPQPFG